MGTQLSIKSQQSERHTSADTLFEGNLICRQYQHGYRFSIDAVLLAHFPIIRSHETILDLGTGCGIIGLILIYRNTDKLIHVTGIEQQPELLLCAEQNRSDNGYEQQFTILPGAVEHIDRLCAPESFSLVIANPPFFSSGSGRTNLNDEQKKARHQGPGGIQKFIAAAARSVRNRCRVALIYPANQIVELTSLLKKNRLEPKRIKFVYAYPESNAQSRLVLVESIKNGRTGVKIEPPCYIYEKRNGAYSTLLQNMYRP